jgi:type I restriction enzyme S subunit
VKSYIESFNAGGSGRAITKGHIESFQVALPPQYEQRAIGQILGALDDKIELNHRMNETLGAMARALFKSWFIDFDPVRAKAEGRDPGLPIDTVVLFPDSFDVELKPAGWRWEPLLTQARLISGGTPKTEVAEYWDGGIPWASAKDVSQCGDLFLTTTDGTISDRGLEESATRIVPKLSTVVVAHGATTGRFRLFGRDMAMNQTCYALQSRSQRPFWLAAAFAGLVDELVHAAHGSVFDTITTSTLERARVIVGDDRLLNAFEERVTPLYQRVLINCEESRTLAALRDALLPKLISGELRVKDAEKFVGGAA